MKLHHRLNEVKSNAANPRGVDHLVKEGSHQTHDGFGQLGGIPMNGSNKQTRQGLRP